MFNNVEHWFKQLNKTLEQAKRIYEEFRLYSLGSYALNRLTPTSGLYRSKQYCLWFTCATSSGFVPHYNTTPAVSTHGVCAWWGMVTWR